MPLFIAALIPNRNIPGGEYSFPLPGYIAVIMRKEVIIIGRINHKHCCHLFNLIETGRFLCAASGFIQCRQQHCGEYGNDRNHNEQLNKSETGAFPALRQDSFC